MSFLSILPGIEAQGPKVGEGVTLTIGMMRFQNGEGEVHASLPVAENLKIHTAHLKLPGSIPPPWTLRGTKGFILGTHCQSLESHGWLCTYVFLSHPFLKRLQSLSNLPIGYHLSSTF